MVHDQVTSSIIIRGIEFPSLKKNYTMLFENTAWRQSTARLGATMNVELELEGILEAIQYCDIASLDLQWLAGMVDQVSTDKEYSLLMELMQQTEFFPPLCKTLHSREHSTFVNYLLRSIAATAQSFFACQCAAAIIEGAYMCTCCSPEILFQKLVSETNGDDFLEIGTLLFDEAVRNAILCLVNRLAKHYSDETMMNESRVAYTQLLVALIRNVTCGNLGPNFGELKHRNDATVLCDTLVKISRTFRPGASPLNQALIAVLIANLFATQPPQHVIRQFATPDVSNLLTDLYIEAGEAYVVINATEAFLQVHWVWNIQPILVIARTFLLYASSKSFYTCATLFRELALATPPGQKRFSLQELQSTHCYHLVPLAQLHCNSVNLELDLLSKISQLHKEIALSTFALHRQQDCALHVALKIAFCEQELTTPGIMSLSPKEVVTKISNLYWRFEREFWIGQCDRHSPLYNLPDDVIRLITESMWQRSVWMEQDE